MHNMCTVYVVSDVPCVIVHRDHITSKVKLVCVVSQMSACANSIKHSQSLSSNLCLRDKSVLIGKRMDEYMGNDNKKW